jgi:2-oxoisovalerate dehydrogenase E1 component
MNAIPADALAHAEWAEVAFRVLLSRALDSIEEKRLVPERKVLYQFSARGHELGQTLLGARIDHPHDGVAVYYRSRPLMLAMGVSLTDAAAGPLARAGSFSDGRDIGVVFNRPGLGCPTVLPACGGVGSQYTPAVGWAQAIRYRRDVLGDASYARAVAIVHGGDASTATNGFWAALNIATTLRLPVLFYIEDNGYGISVTSDRQTPGRDIAANLAAFKNLRIFSGSASEPLAARSLIDSAMTAVRDWSGPVLLRLTMPRLSGHSGQDTQTYKSAETLKSELARDPVAALHRQLVPGVMSETSWRALSDRAEQDVLAAVREALDRPQPDARQATRFAFSEAGDDGALHLQLQGGVLPSGHEFAASSHEPSPEAVRINMVSAIRRTLDHELRCNPKMLVFGEDVGPKGGVHGATLGLQHKYGVGRVFDTSLSEEGIIGRAVGMALAGLLPVPEIQFRKYADPAVEQLNDCGTIRWRTANRFAAPMVVRMPGGYFKCGDPWHSQSNEVQWVHAVGWRVAMPSNAHDAVGLLRSALRGNDPTIFFEHRAMLDGAWARRAYPGDEFVIPFGRANTLRSGDALTLVCWGAMVERCEAAAKSTGVSVEVIDLRTLAPWDEDAVMTSVKKTRRCLIVHEDTMTAGFGAEIAARISQEAFFHLDAPVTRLAMPDIPSPHNPALLDAVLPSVDSIAGRIRDLAEF